MQKQWFSGILIFGALMFVLVLVLLLARRSTQARQNDFDGQRAFQDVVRQVEFGFRIPGSAAHAEVVSWITAELTQAAWDVELQETTRMGHPIRNIVARRGQGSPWIILGAHYDTRIYADRDPDPAQRANPVPGANDGASGVAVLLEIARVLPKEISGQTWLVFFDAEDNGDIPGWEWILGSTAFVEGLQSHPDAAIIVDMIGDADLNIYLEGNSDAELSQQIWGTAAELGYGKYFINEPKVSILDDHIPFIMAGIPAVDIIDFDYRYWHTTADTPDKVSAKSLKAVGDTLLAWLASYP